MGRTSCRPAGARVEQAGGQAAGGPPGCGVLGPRRLQMPPCIVIPKTPVALQLFGPTAHPSFFSTPDNEEWRMVGGRQLQPGPVCRKDASLLLG